VEHRTFAEAGRVMEGEASDAHGGVEEVEAECTDGSFDASFALDAVFNEFAEERVAKEEEGKSENDEERSDDYHPAEGAFHWLKLEDPSPSP
jgi:hypothetical protein